MLKNILTTVVLLAFVQGAFAVELLCSRPDSTRSFQIDVNAIEKNGSQFASVRIIQYPSHKTLFFEVIENNASKIHLNNSAIFFQADRDLVLHFKGGKTTLETFWIRGSSGFGIGGDSGSYFLPCENI